MPRPRTGESRQHFVSRAIPIIKEEEPSKTNKQAAGKAYGIYDNWREKIRGHRHKHDKRGGKH